MSKMFSLSHCSGHHKSNSLIENHFADSASLSDCYAASRQAVPWPVAERELAKAIVRRRSIREFDPVTAISLREYETITRAVTTEISSDCDRQVTIMAVVHRVDGMKPGIYRGQECLRQGNFTTICASLCLEQRLGSDGAVTFFLTAATGKNYLPLMEKAGILGQRIYLAATLLGIGCSGIGAFYDRETADFLYLNEMILYAVAVGR